MKRFASSFKKQKIMNTITFSKLLKSFIFIYVLILSISCNKAENSYFKEDIAIAADGEEINSHYDAIEESGTGSTLNDDQTFEIRDLKIIKTANVRFKVKNVQESTQTIKALVNDYEGYISNMRFSNNSYQKENSFTIKVPRDNFDKLLDSLSSVAEFIDHIEIASKDVTEEYMDVETRLKTKLEVKARYEEILRNNAKTVKDILETEEKLRIIQEEIEVAQGRLKYMVNRISFSTINVVLYETVEYKEQPDVYKRTFGSEITEALSSGWNLIKNMFLGIIYIWPLILLIAGVILFIRIRKKNKLKN